MKRNQTSAKAEKTRRPDRVSLHAHLRRDESKAKKYEGRFCGWKGEE